MIGIGLFESEILIDSRAHTEDGTVSLGIRQDKPPIANIFAKQSQCQKSDIFRCGMMKRSMGLASGKDLGKVDGCVYVTFHLPCSVPMSYEFSAQAPGSDLYEFVKTWVAKGARIKLFLPGSSVSISKTQPILQALREASRSAGTRFDVKVEARAVKAKP
jgi:hypothetical protein